MESLQTLGIIALGIFIRFVIPIGVTALLVWYFRRLDQQWQEEAKQASVQAMPQNPGCWKINKCSAEQRAKCRAYANREKPCWQVYRSEDGLLQEKCLGCDVFKKAPIPVLA